MGGIAQRTFYHRFQAEGRAYPDARDGVRLGETMLKSVDAVTTEQVNAAIRKHLQTANVKFLIVTHEKEAERLADDIAAGTRVVSKSQAEYNIPDPVPAGQRHILERDAAWKQYPLGITRDRIRIVPVDRMFETTELP